MGIFNRKRKQIKSTEDIPYDPKRPDTLVICRTRKGSTQQYAEWIQKALDCDMIPFDRNYLGMSVLYENVIILSWLRSSEIVGLKMIRENQLRFLLPEKHVIVGAVGIAEPTEHYIDYVKELNTGMGFDYPSFHFLPGRVNLSRMGTADRMMVRAFEKSQYDGMNEEEAAVFRDRITNGWDGVEWKAIQPIVREIRQIRKDKKAGKLQRPAAKEDHAALADAGKPDQEEGEGSTK